MSELNDNCIHCNAEKHNNLDLPDINVILDMKSDEETTICKRCYFLLWWQRNDWGSMWENATAETYKFRRAYHKALCGLLFVLGFFIAFHGDDLWGWWQ